MPNPERVSIEIEDHVAHVRLVRGDKHNALDFEMFEAIRDTIDEIENTKGVRCAVLSGEGPSFCSGLDLTGMGPDFDPENLIGRPNDEVANLAQQVTYGWRGLRVPSIAAIHGACYGGGIQIALGLDMRIAAPDAKLSVMEIRLGLIPDMGLSQSLPRLVRDDVAKELVFTGRVVSGEEAGALGLVTRVDPDPTDAALELARLIASKSPDSVQGSKRLIDEHWFSDARTSLAAETATIRPLFGSVNQMEAVRAAMTKEDPTFADAEPGVWPAEA